MVDTQTAAPEQGSLADPGVDNPGQDSLVAPAWGIQAGLDLLAARNYQTMNILTSNHRDLVQRNSQKHSLPVPTNLQSNTKS